MSHNISQHWSLWEYLPLYFIPKNEKEGVGGGGDNIKRGGGGLE